jgi:uncharacterized protein (UPF0335 family)
MTSQSQIKAFVDRILRLKEEQDALRDDIKDIYAEAKGLGFDKTAIGNVVSHVRKIGKKGDDAVAATTANFEMYLAAYEGRTHAYARAEVPHDPETGEVFEDAQITVVDHGDEEGNHLTVTVDPRIAAILNGTSPESPRKAAEAEPERAATTDATIAPVLVEADKVEAVAEVLGQPELISALTGQHASANVSGSERAGVTAGETAINFQREPKPLRPYCQRPGAEDCGGYGSKHCHSCERLHAGSEAA